MNSWDLAARILMDKTVKEYPVCRLRDLPSVVSGLKPESTDSWRRDASNDRRNVSSGDVE